LNAFDLIRASILRRDLDQLQQCMDLVSDASKEWGYGDRLTIAHGFARQLNDGDWITREAAPVVSGLLRLRLFEKPLHAATEDELRSVEEKLRVLIDGN
jgi:hypothetical protein